MESSEDARCLKVKVIVNLTFRGPCIVMYSFKKCQRDELFLIFN